MCPFFPQQEKLTFPTGRITDWIMAQTNSGGQGTNGVADESPNMIVYRKVRQLLFLAGTCFGSLRVCNSPCTSCSMTGRAVEITDGEDRRLAVRPQYQLSDSDKRTRRLFHCCCCKCETCMLTGF